MKLKEFQSIQEYLNLENRILEVKEIIRAFKQCQKGECFTLEQVEIVHREMKEVCVEDYLEPNVPLSFQLYIDFFLTNVKMVQKSIERVKLDLAEQGINIDSIQLELKEQLEQMKNDLPF